MWKTPTRQQVDAIREAVESVDGWEGDHEDIPELDVQLDSIASALASLRKRQSKTRVEQVKEATLSHELAALVEHEIVEPHVVSLADDIAELIRTKDYVGYAEGYVERRLSELVGELCDELGVVVRKLENEVT